MNKFVAFNINSIPRLNNLEADLLDNVAVVPLLSPW
jgi:hypothetical protein